MPNHKSFRFEIKTITEEGQFEGYASVFGNVDEDGEVFDSGAFKKTVKEQDVFPLYWMHEWKDNPYSIPIGSINEASEDSHGLTIIGELNMESSRVRTEVYPLMKKRVISRMSVGFKTIKDAWVGGTRHIKEVKLGEVSLTVRGFEANQLAAVTAVKSTDIPDGQETEEIMLDKFLEVKTADMITTLAEVMEAERLRDLRWDIQSALSDVIELLIVNTELTVEAKQSLLATSLDQYKELMLAWFAQAVTVVKCQQTDELRIKTISALLSTQPEPEKKSTTEPEEPQEAVKSLMHLCGEIRSDLANRRAS